MSPSRQGDRKQVSFPASVQCGGRTIRDVVKDVSPSGLYLQADRHRFRAGERVRISFSLPIAGRLVPVVVDGRVARVATDRLHRTKGIGVQLINPRPEMVEVLQAYADAASREGRGGPEVPEDPTGPRRPPAGGTDARARKPFGAPAARRTAGAGFPERAPAAEPPARGAAMPDRAPLATPAPPPAQRASEPSAGRYGADPFGDALEDARLASPLDEDDEPTETSTWALPDDERTDPGFTVIEDDD